MSGDPEAENDASQLADETRPFDLPGHGAVQTRSVALCVHGLTSTPREVLPVAEALAARGIRAVGPMLPGHDTTPEALARVHHSEWLEVVHTHLDELGREHEAVFLVGVSLGGLLSLAAASERDVDAVAVVGVPLDFGWLRSRLPALLKYVLPYLAKAGGADIRDPASRERHVSYPVMPLAAVEQLVHVQRLVQSRLASITVPVLAAHGRHDRTASPGDLDRILEGLGSGERERLMLDESGHIATLDYDGPRLVSAIAAFLASRAR